MMAKYQYQHMHTRMKRQQRKKQEMQLASSYIAHPLCLIACSRFLPSLPYVHVEFPSPRDGLPFFLFNCNIALALHPCWLPSFLLCTVLELISDLSMYARLPSHLKPSQVGEYTKRGHIEPLHAHDPPTILQCYSPTGRKEIEQRQMSVRRMSVQSSR